MSNDGRLHEHLIPLLGDGSDLVRRSDHLALLYTSDPEVARNALAGLFEMDAVKFIDTSIPIDTKRFPSARLARAVVEWMDRNPEPGYVLPNDAWSLRGFTREQLQPVEKALHRLLSRLIEDDPAPDRNTVARWITLVETGASDRLLAHELLREPADSTFVEAVLDALSGHSTRDSPHGQGESSQPSAVSSSRLAGPQSGNGDGSGAPPVKRWLSR